MGKFDENKMHNVDLTTLYGYLDQGILLLLSGLALWIGIWVATWLSKHATFLDAQTQKNLADGLNRALQNGVRIAMTQLNAWESVHKDIQVQGQITAWAAQYAADHSPQAIAKFGLDPQELALKALAYLPSPQTSQDTTGQTVKTELVTTQTLPPIEIPPGH